MAFRNRGTSDSAKIDALAVQLGTVLVELARVGTQIESMRSDQTRTSVEVARDLADHELRLRDLQHWRDRIVGWLAGASAAGGLSGAGIAVTVQHFLQ